MAVDPAEKRMWILTGVRLLGVFLCAAAVILVARQAWGEATRWFALAIMVAGVWLALFIPRNLLKRWKSDG